MTNAEAQQFIDIVLKSFYPDWNPTDIDFSEWVKRLYYYDYSRAKQAVSDFVFETKIKYKTPPAGNIIGFFKKKGAEIRVQQERRSNDPVVIFEIVPEGRSRGQVFTTKTWPDEHIIEQMAERAVRRMNLMYQCNHIIKYRRPTQEPDKDNTVLGQEAFELMIVNVLGGTDCWLKDMVTEYQELNNCSEECLRPWTKFYKWLANKTLYEGIEKNKSIIPNTASEKNRQKSMLWT